MTVVLFHSVCGLRPAVRAAADRIRTTGHEVVVPDLFDGRTTNDVEAGMKIKDEIAVEELSRRAAVAAAPYAGDAVYAGFSLGAGLAQDLALQDPGTRGLLLMHGTSDVPEDAVAGGLAVQLHVADPDPFEPGEWLEEWQEGMRRAGARAELFRYPGPGHLFTDPEVADYDEQAAETAWTRALTFLREL